MFFKDIILLVFLQALWAGSYAAVKIALIDFELDALIALRYTSAAIILVILTTILKQHTLPKGKDLIWVGLLGILVYVVSPLLAFRGVDFSQSLDVSVLVSLEPLATALLATWILKEKLEPRKRTAIFVAIPGVLLLSNVFSASFGHASGLRLLGNLLFLASLFCEASHTITGRFLSRRYSPLAISTYGFVIGSTAFLLTRGLPALSRIDTMPSVRGILAVLYLAVLCSAFGYTVWFFLLKRIPANTVAVSLYLQPVIGALIGYFWLKESLNLSGLIGIGLILVGVSVGLYAPNQRGSVNKKKAA